ncbi:toxin-antitoxin system HicB family antitoxin [Sphingomonas rubra]|uniref:HicB family protein n=1 Tax=Sphingomonas rubra TaxID=634430 RepID=A0A1I5QV28_9SPHN|nr:toxin-antitoxin system HicB family antitoxin [Sphingomonas rubra]SFP50083.1 HicB family protein [Sphingomonas rubra]
MNDPATYPLRLPRSIKDAVARAAQQDGISMNQFISSAVAEKLAVFETLGYLEKRAARADYEAFDRFLSRSGGEPPRDGDELPDGYVSIR